MPRPVNTVIKPAPAPVKSEVPIFHTVSYIVDGGKVAGAVARLVFTGPKPATIYLSKQGRESLRVAFGNRSL